MAMAAGSGEEGRLDGVRCGMDVQPPQQARRPKQAGTRVHRPEQK